MPLAAYSITQQIHSGRNSVVSRGVRRDDGLPIVIKLLKQEYPEPAERARFRLEFELAKRLAGHGVIGIYELAESGNTLAIVMEDFGACSLKSYLGGLRIGAAEATPGAASQGDVSQLLRLAVQVARALDSVHEKGAIHKDLNPSNIVIHAPSGQLKIIDFGISSSLLQEEILPANPGSLEGTLLYMSPEQTGRVNRAVDYRTDFYSLGVTLFEMLTGVLPFDAGDAMEMIHCHIARRPPLVHDVNPAVPAAISAIVARLLAKNADERYQTVRGLIYDLEYCLESGIAARHDFQPGTRDRSDRFQIAQKLYGREAELAALIAAFDRASSGRTELVLVSGDAGVGKTALVRELQKTVVQRHGSFVSGKFDQLNRNIPYASLVHALRDLLRNILAESAASVAEWRARLGEALSPNASTLADVLPELELILGPQERAPELPAAEARNRFHHVFRNLVRALADRGHSLVIFLDDLQWADSASLDLVRILATAREPASLLLICAYRDREIAAGQPLRVMLDALAAADAGGNREIAVAELDAESVRALVCDTLRCDSARGAPLADLLFRKTNGNPFFLAQTLRSMHDRRLLVFDSVDGAWHWDADRLGDLELSENVIDLMTEKICGLPAATRHVLEFAACAGNRFDLATLSAVLGSTSAAVAHDLWPALTEGLVLPLGDAYRYAALEEALPTAPQYRFLHDRVQQAAYSLLPEKRRPSAHLQIGRALHTDALRRGVNVDERLFDIVDQFDLGAGEAVDDTERPMLAELHLRAARRAKASAAFGPAREYLRHGIAMLAPTSWRLEYELALALHVESVETCYLTGRFEEMESHAVTVLERARTLFDAVPVHEVRIHYHNGQNRPAAAVATAMGVLRLLGIDLPRNPGNLQILSGLLRTKVALRGRRIEALADLPAMTDERALAALRIMTSVLAAVYISAPNLMPLVVCRMIILSAKHGNAPISGFAYASYGFILCGVLGKIEDGYRFGRMALDFVDRANAREHLPKTHFMFYHFIQHWKEHLRESIQPLLRAYCASLDVGDLQFASYNVDHYLGHMLYTGGELAPLQRELASYRTAVADIQQEQIVWYVSQQQQMVANLLGAAGLPWDLCGEHYDAEKMLPVHMEARSYYGVFTLNTYRLMLAVFFSRFDAAIEAAGEADKYAASAVGSPLVPIACFYRAVAELAVANATLGRARAHAVRRARTLLKKLRGWCRHAPDNHAHRIGLLEAELLAIAGEDPAATDGYERAIDLARQGGYLHEEGLAAERGGLFHLRRGRPRIARTYLLESRYCFQRWGAAAVVRRLDEAHPELLLGAPERGRRPSLVATTTHTDSVTLDVDTVVQASQALAGEVSLDRLCARIMTMTCRTAGAERGLLVLATDGRLCVEATTGQTIEDVTVLGSLPVEDGADHLLPIGLVLYVARAQEPVMLADAAAGGPFAGDPYIARNRTQSVLCLPIVLRGALTGVLYLENNLASGVFAPERMDLLSFLSAQAAIFIENARLFEKKEQAQKETLRLAQEVAQRDRRHHEAMLRTARLEIDLCLRKSIQPHFLMNSLTALVGWLEEDPATASRLLNALAGELQMTLSAAAQPLVPLKDELALCRAHLEVMSLRQGKQYELEAEGVVHEEPIPPLILLTLVENGISHGYTDRTRRTFRLVRTETDDAVVFRLSNNSQVRSKSPREGTGLRYVRSRLEEAFPNRWNLEYGPIPDGWRVSIEIRHAESEAQRGARREAQSVLLAP